ncbi:MAG TPA: signal peptidase I [Acidimicrobiia bacterium]|nr:signal peptidase I [Acidimicrobiia bacterium]
MRAATALLVVASAAAVVAFLPADLGGSATYMTTHGTSMEPRFHTGDLAIVKPANHYAVGDVVAYRSPSLHNLVLHRIVAIHGLHYVFKGDHNSWRDADHPSRADLVGKLWLHVPHGGSVLTAVHRAWVFVLAGGLLLLTGTTGVVVGRRRRRTRRGAAAVEPIRPRATRPRRGRRRAPRRVTPGAGGISRSARRGAKRLRVLAALELGASAALVVCIALGTLTWARPASRFVSEPVRYTNQGEFGYGATVGAGPVYGDGAIRTGDPVYLRILDKIAVHFGYRFAASAPHAVSGTVALSVDVQDASGWRQTVPLVAPSRFSGDHARVETTLDVAQIQALVAAAAGATGVRPTTQTVRIVADVQVAGRLAGLRVDDRFSPGYTFELDPLVLKPDAGVDARTSGTSPRPSARGSVTDSVRRPTTAGAFGLTVAVGTARWSAVGGAALALLVLLVVAAKRRPLHRNEVARIDARDGRMIVPVAASSPGSQLVATVDVTSMPDLVRLAERYDRLILHQTRRGNHVYLFEAEGIVYRYCTQGVRAAVPEAS